MVKNTLRWDQLNLHHRDGDQFVRYLAEYSRTSTVFVRAHWSEQVYSELYERQEPFSPREYECLNTAATLRGITVLCLPRSVDALKARYLQRQKTGLDCDKQLKLEMIDKEYRIWQQTLAGDADFIYHSENEEELRNAVEDIVKRVEDVRGLL